jgi:two-component system, LytTR family, response regulator
MQPITIASNRDIAIPTVIRPLPVQGLRLPFPDGKRFVTAENIIALRSLGNYTFFHFQDGSTLLYSRTLRHVLGRLPASCFARIHRSHAINRHHIHTYSTTHVLLSDGSEWTVSRRRSI